MAYVARFGGFNVGVTGEGSGQSIGRAPSRSTKTAHTGAIPTTVRGVWTDFWSQPWSFKWTCIYIFFEYVRPQQVYPVLQFAPWALLALVGACTAVILEGRSWRVPPAIGSLVGAFTLVIIASSVFAFVPSMAFKKLDVWVNWLIAMALIATAVRSPKQFYLFLVLFILWSTKMSQHGMRAFLISGGGASGAPGWFQNTGEFALQMCVYVPLTAYAIIALRPKLSKSKVMALSLLPISGVLSILGSGSRGGQLALAVVGLWMLYRSKHKVRGLMLVAVVAPLLWLALPAAQKERFTTAGEDKTSVARLAYWKAGLEMARTHPLLGVGYENWVSYYISYYPRSKGGYVRYDADGTAHAEVSHNSFVEVVSQLGFPGLLLFSSILIGIWRLNAQTRRTIDPTGDYARLEYYLSCGLDCGVIGFIVAGFFMAVAFYPFVWIQLGMAISLNQAVRHGSQKSTSTPRARTRHGLETSGLRNRRLTIP